MEPGGLKEYVEAHEKRDSKGRLYIRTALLHESVKGALFPCCCRSGGDLDFIGFRFAQMDHSIEHATTDPGFDFNCFITFCSIMTQGLLWFVDSRFFMQALAIR